MRHRTFGASMGAILRAAAQAERARQQAQARQEAATRRAVREAERRTRADAKEAARDHVAAQIEEAEALTQEVRQREKAIETLLTRALAKNPAIDLNEKVKRFEPARFDERRWPLSPPNKATFAAEPQGFFARMLPGASGRQKQIVQEADRRFEDAQALYDEQRRDRAAALMAFEADEEARKSEIERENAAIRELQRSLGVVGHAAVLSYFQTVVDASLKGEPDAVSAELGFSPDSKHLVIDLELPDLSAVPEESGYKYIRSANRIEFSPTSCR